MANSTLLSKNSLPQLWGVINLTSDSFYAASRAEPETAVRRALAMLSEGAAVVDVGAESTRPGACPIPDTIQIARLVRFLEDLRAEAGAATLRRISIDTRSLAVMQKVVEFGIGYINDTSGGSEDVYRFIAESGVSYVLMHIQGTPETMQLNPQYEDVFAEVEEYLLKRSEKLLKAGVKPTHIIWDTGIGFGKTVEHNLILLARQHALRRHGFRLLAGVSRKSFIGRILGQDDPNERLYGTLAVQLYLTLRGLDILRVHDVKPMSDALVMIDALRRYELHPA
ncbi:MAG: dihydropteroate synthase [Turneriella sp.]|nr:dihydropteroate synthase [Leptospiraceae bacterium]MCX7632339.1 dihydropteroate synthase [Turneriella sp.]